jgi:hypothetical protein
MCACAGSLTERFGVNGPGRRSWSHPLRHRIVPAAGRKIFLRKFAGRGPDGPQPGRIGFMSTERREEHRRRRTMCMESVALPARFRPEGLYVPPGNPDRRFKESLRTDHRIQERVRVMVPDLLRRLPPPGAGPRAADFRSSHFGFPTPARLLGLHPSLPPIPAPRSRRAERYDGKRDLYIQHAARNAACNS